MSDDETKDYLNRATETLLAMCVAQLHGELVAISWDTFIANLRLYADGMERAINPATTGAGTPPEQPPTATPPAPCSACRGEGDVPRFGNEAAALLMVPHGERLRETCRKCGGTGTQNNSSTGQEPA